MSKEPGTRGEGRGAKAEKRPTVSTRLARGLLFLVGGVVFCSGINWGLPSRAVDRFLFGNRPPWSGEEIVRLAGGWSDDRTRGADVDVDPLEKGGQPIPLNDTDARRAEIVRRYRLYTYQPDEMITLRALAGMRPGQGQLDPRLYQYGGLWIYPVGAMLKLASMAGLVTLKPDVAWYLDHPEEFGKLYVVARLYAVLWGLVGAWVVFWIARRLSDDCMLSAVFAALCYIFMPVVINMAHEAKPHLPGAVLQLLAIMAAMRYVETGRRGWWLATAIACGAAFGMVLSAWPVFIVLPLMVLLRPDTWRRRIGLAVSGVGIGVGVYLLTNPYIVINLFVNREVLRSNFGNSLAMYEIGRWPEGMVNAARLVAEGASMAAASIGLLAVLVAAGRYVAANRRWGSRPAPLGSGDASGERPVRNPAATTNAADTRSPAATRPPAIIGSPAATGVPAGAGSPAAATGPLSPTARYALLLAVPAGLILVQFVALAAGKPGEYGRFAVLPDVALGIAAVVAIGRLFFSRTAQTVALAGLLMLVAAPGGYYLVGFRLDSGPVTSRLNKAEALAELRQVGLESLAVFAEPAPYSLPPVDLFKWRILLLPEGYVHEAGKPPADVLVRAVDDPRAKISWANKPFLTWGRRSAFPIDGPADTAPASQAF